MEWTGKDITQTAETLDRLESLRSIVADIDDLTGGLTIRRCDAERLLADVRQRVRMLVLVDTDGMEGR